MLLKHLKISNYRALKEVEMPLSAFVCLTGENNAGKSSVLQALSLFLSGTTLAATNYFESTQPITIAVTLTEIGDADLALLAPEHRARIEPLIANQSITLVRQYGTDGRSQFGYFGMVPLEARFSEPSREELMKGKKGADLRTAVIAQFAELSHLVFVGPQGAHRTGLEGGREGNREAPCCRHSGARRHRRNSLPLFGRHRSSQPVHVSAGPSGRSH